jgi:inositol oxygenase
LLPQDLELREWLKKFQIADLYSKSENLPNVQELMPHYLALIDKYCPGVLDW